MKVVIDSNKIISAVVSKGIVRRIVVFSGINFYAPKVVIEEIEKHREEIYRRIGLKTEFFNYILEELILPRLNIVEERARSKPTGLRMLNNLGACCC
jgi:predicted nucleic acid-binding protein